jgi:hypothetical protein
LEETRGEETRWDETRREQSRSTGWRGLNGWLALASVGGLTASVLMDFPVRTSADAVSDLKTLYASSWCLTHGQNAYSFAEIERVFRAQGIGAPQSWFGHAPVYPPTTLVMLAPLTAAPVTWAAYGWTVVSAMLLGLAAVALFRSAEDCFGLSWRWRAVLAGLLAAGPLVSFALGVGNLSVAAAALSLLAFLRRKRGSVWGNAGCLALAVVLKPHLAIWVAVGMMLLPERAARRVAGRGLGMAAGFCGVVAAGLMARGTLGIEARAFRAMLGMETAVGGSMNASSREVLPIVSQITSLRSVVGFWTDRGTVLWAVAGVVLLAFAMVLGWRTLKVRTEAEAILAVGAWSAFGMMATYHRAHDGIVLLLLLPYLLAKLRTVPGSWKAWAGLGMYGAMSLGPGLGVIRGELAGGGVGAFLLMRQAALVDLCLFAVLLGMLRDEEKADGRFRARVGWFADRMAEERVLVAGS